MADRLTFDDIKNAVSIEDGMKMLNLKMKRSGNEYRGNCPACKGDRDLSVPISGYYKGMYTCWSTKKRMDIVGLTAHLMGFDQGKAAEHVKRRFGLGDSSSTTPSPPAKAESMQPLDYLDELHDQVEALGVSPATAHEIGIGHASKGFLRGMVGVPVRLPDGTLLGYFGIPEGSTVKFHKSVEENANIVRLDERRKA